MPFVQPKDTVSSLAAANGMSIGQFLAIPGNEKFKATGPNSYQGATNLIQPGDEYFLVTQSTQPTAIQNSGSATTSQGAGSSSNTGNTMAEIFAPDVQEQDPYYGTQEANLLESANAVVDENTIRENTRKRFQDEINAINAIYDQQLGAARKKGLQDIGSGTAIIARRGLAGSGRGQGIESSITQNNLDIEKAIQAERAASIAAVMSQADNLASQELTRQREAKEKGAAAYLDFLKTKEERVNASIQGIAASFLDQGVEDLTTIQPQIFDQVLANLKKAYGSTTVTKDKIISSFNEAKKNKDAEIAAAELEKAKLNPAFELSEGQARYAYDLKTGEYKKIAERAKTTTPKTGVTAGSNVGGNAFASDLDAIIGNTLATIPSKFGQEQFQSQISRARNDADKISTVAAVVLKGAPAQVKSDFGNQAIAVSSIDKAIKLIDEGTKTGIIKNGIQYTYNVFGKDFDPKLAAINSYITSAIQPYRSSITGAAWGDQEDQEYAQLFGSTKYSPEELKNRLVRIKDIMKNKSVVGLNAYVNPLDTYANPFQYTSTTPPLGTTTGSEQNNTNDPLGLFN